MCDFFMDVVIPVLLTLVLGIGVMFLFDEVLHIRKGMRRW